MNLTTTEHLIALDNDPSMIIPVLPILNQRMDACTQLYHGPSSLHARQESRRESLTLSRA